MSRRQLGGTNATVTSILSNPDQDPHLFEASPSVARLLVGRSIVVYNGADYDPWMTQAAVGNRVARPQGHRRCRSHAPESGRQSASLVRSADHAGLSQGAGDGAVETRPTHKADYDRNLQTFLTSLQPLDAKIVALREKFGGIQVTATEPVFGYMSAALGFSMRNERFQLAVMNNTEPRASDVCRLRRRSRARTSPLLFYNSQATDPAAQRLAADRPAVEDSRGRRHRDQPPGKSYQAWMMSELDAIAQALNEAPS